MNELLYVLTAETAAPVSSGRDASGERRAIPITGGRFEGRISGEVVPGGTDWQIIRPDGLVDIDARYHLRTTEGGVIEVRSRGMRWAEPEIDRRLAAGELVDPSLYYFRTIMRFQTAAPELQWLTRLIAAASGRRVQGGVQFQVYKLP